MENKTIVITGATSGVGEKLVNQFSSKGFNVIALGRDELKLNKLRANNIKCIKADIRIPKEVQIAFSSIKKIDILVNNASIFKMKKFDSFNTKEIDDILDTNLKGTIYCTLEAIKKMNKGRIINISSVSGTHGIKNQAVYSSSKYGVIGFAESLAQELKEKGILISTICPGGINTPLWNESNPYPGNIEDLITTDDIFNTLNYIINLPDNVIVKTITMFPNCEWH